MYTSIRPDPLPMMDNVDTSISDYVRLSLRFGGDRGYIDWKSEWKIEDMEVKIIQQDE